MSYVFFFFLDTFNGGPDRQQEEKKNLVLKYNFLQRMKTLCAKTDARRLASFYQHEGLCICLWLILSYLSHRILTWSWTPQRVLPCYIYNFTPKQSHSGSCDNPLVGQMIPPTFQEG